MDIKLKNNRKNRNCVIIGAIALAAVLSVCTFPGIARRANGELERRNIEMMKQEKDINEAAVKLLYHACYVLNLEYAQREENMSAADVYMKAERSASEQQESEYAGRINDFLENWSNEFEQYRSAVDYCVLLPDGTYEKNTERALEKAVLGSETEKEALDSYYDDYFTLGFNENGVFEIHAGAADAGSEFGDLLIKSFLQADRKDSLRTGLNDLYGMEITDVTVGTPVNFKVIFGITPDASEQIAWKTSDHLNNDYYYYRYVYASSGTAAVYLAGLTLVAALMLVMTSRRVRMSGMDGQMLAEQELPEYLSMNRPGNWYLMEAAVIGVICVMAMREAMVSLAGDWSEWEGIRDIYRAFTANQFAGAWEVVGTITGSVFGVFCIYFVWYVSLRFLRPVFTLGLWEYIRQYSFCYQIIPLVSRIWKKFVTEVQHIDFSQKSIKTIIKIVAVNFAVLVLCSCLWFFGIFALVVYSVVLFFLIKKYYDKIVRDYQVLQRGVNRIAMGDLNTVITEDIGVFEPIKGELEQVRTGFKRAVDEEVKSQRMKTELITNVSHDLKTPLTAITTYIELLKKEDITEEERKAYIDTLEKKSLRLKVLIEDLFEVSKASSNNVTLNLVDVDVVNLLKQVSIEHADKFAEQGLDLRWNVPEEKLVQRLDSQKTYRIFENLFVNVVKYAMPGSRVYVEVRRTGAGPVSGVEIVMKNMSAEELTVSSEDLTERFVRGDSARNTEGSGLGLAIAKSFAEVQNGKLHVAVDGDLFKVVICFGDMV